MKPTQTPAAPGGDKGGAKGKGLKDITNSKPPMSSGTAKKPLTSGGKAGGSTTSIASKKTTLVHSDARFDEIEYCPPPVTGTPFTHSPLFSPPSLSSQPHSTALLLNPNPGDADSPSRPRPSPSSSRVKLESKYVPDFPVDLAPFTKLLKKDALFQPRHSFEVPDFKVDFEPTRAGITPSSTLPEISLDDLSFGDDDPAFDSSSLMF